MIRRHLAARRVRKQAAAEYRAEVEETVARWDAEMRAAVDLAIEEAQRAAVPGNRPRVDVEDVLDVLARPMFSDREPSPRVVAAELRDRLRSLDDSAGLDTDAYDALHNPLRPPGGEQKPRDSSVGGAVEVRLIGSDSDVQRIVEAFVEVAGLSRATPVSYRPARDGAAVRARFTVIAPEADR